MSISLQEVINRSSEVVLHMAVAGGAGYLCSRIFSIVNPIHGAVFCATSSLISKIIDPFFERAFNGLDSNAASRLTGNLLSTGVGIVISASVATAMGFAIGFNAALTLTAIVAALRIITMVGLELARTSTVN